ncbi:MAG: PKD-like domain-containing protein [Cytophagales bacterium]|nr:PKD-like domain-containing protein [Cytophagales bacterium]
MILLQLFVSDTNANYDLATNISNIGAGGNNLVAGTTYSWVAADNPSVTGETLVAANTSVINDILNNVTGSNQVVVYTIIPTSANGCIGDAFTVSVTVRPEPIGLADTDAVCSDEQINYNIQTRNINLLGNSVASQFTYTVISSNPGNVSVAGKNRPVASNAAITDTYTNTTSVDVLITYTITPFSTTGNCQGSPFDVVVTIHPEPLGPNTVAQRCSDVPVNFDLQDVINTVGTGNSVPSKFKYSVTSNNALAVPPRTKQKRSFYCSDWRCLY